GCTFGPRHAWPQEPWPDEPAPASAAYRRAVRRCVPPGATTARTMPPLGRRGASRRLLEPLGGDLVADLLQRPPDQARDVHLGDADLLGDLGLRQALEEPQVEDLPLARVERAEARLEHRAVLRHLVLVLLGADRLERVDLVVVATRGPDRQRERAVRPSALEGLEHLFLLDVRRLRQLGDRRRTLELHGQLLDEPRQLHVQLLQ